MTRIYGLRITTDKMYKLDGRVCFICGKYLLNNSHADLAYMPVHTGRSVRAKPDKYHLFQCPNCDKIAHKRCWYDNAEQKIKKGWFGPTKWQLQCPSCGHKIGGIRDEKRKWKDGYQIPGHPDSELPELRTADVLSWKAGTVFSKIGRAIDSFFKSVGLGSLSSSESSAVASAAGKVGRSMQDVAEKVFRLEIPPDKRKEIKKLKCQNCGAPLPLPGLFEEAVVCQHCGTAHLMPE